MERIVNHPRVFEPRPLAHRQTGRGLPGRIAACVLFCATALSSAWGAPQPIAIQDPSFEATALQDDTYFGYSGWTYSGWTRDAGWGGIFNPAPGEFRNGSAPDGSNAAWLTEGWLGQTLNEKFQPGTYTLTASIGVAANPRFAFFYPPVNGTVTNPPRGPADPSALNYLHMTLSNGFQGFEFSARNVLLSQVPGSTFADFSTSFVVSKDNGFIGHPIGIGFDVFSPDVTYFAIDNVRLSFTPAVPEPPAWALSAAGLLVLAGAAARRARC